MENNARSRDVFPENLRNSPKKNEQKIEVCIRHNVRLLLPAKMR